MTTTRHHESGVSELEIHHAVHSRVGELKFSPGPIACNLDTGRGTAER